MVFFCCNSCGSSIKKPQVEKHLYQCRTQSLSCMDCHKDFRGDEYKAHTKCISEEEKYAGEGWKAPASRNKGEKKQGAWVLIVQDTMTKAGNTLVPAARNLLQALTAHENVPRKKAKFLNFVSNIGRSRFDANTVNKVWDLLEAQMKLELEKTKAKEAPAPKKAEAEVASSPSTKEQTTKKEKRKKKNEDSTAEASSEQPPDPATDPTGDVADSSVSKKKRKSKSKDVESENDGLTNENDEGSPKKRKRKENGKEETIKGEYGETPKESLTELDNGEVDKARKKKKRKQQEEEDADEAVVADDPEETDDELRKKLKRQRKAERKAAKAAQNGSTLIETNDNVSQLEDSSTETPKETKARLKAERKAARRASRATASD